MVDDHDEIWKPGYVGPPPAPSPLVDLLDEPPVEQLVMVPGALQALVVAGDGFVVLRPAALGTRLAGVDFDGTERWSILGGEPVIVGDRVVVRAASGAAGLRLTTYGDAE